jgi:hypothetical protein
MAELRITQDELHPLIRQILKGLLEEQNQTKTLLDGKIAIREEQAAELLGLNPWQMRDLRLSGKVGYHRIVGNKIRYTMDDLNAYLERTHQPGND